MKELDDLQNYSLHDLGLSDLDPKKPVLIAGPTASGKSSLALTIARAQGGIVVNADASQIYNCWRVITACPSAQEESQAAHALYRHVPFDAPYSAGHWLREILPFLQSGARPIIVGGTGLYFSALTKGLADIPATPAQLRQEADAMSLDALRAQLDPLTLSRIDTQNRMRVQRAWEVLRATGKPLAAWQDGTPPALLTPETATCIVMDASKEWLTPRIAQRFDQMVETGALEEIEAMQERFDPTLPSCRAIGVPELMAHHLGTLSLGEARDAAVIATRQYAKRQRTWFRSKMKHWHQFDPQTLS